MNYFFQKKRQTIEPYAYEDIGQKFNATISKSTLYNSTHKFGKQFNRTLRP